MQDWEEFSIFFLFLQLSSSAMIMISCFSCEVIARERLSMSLIEHSVRTVLLGILRVKGCNEKAFNSSSDIFLVYGGS